MSTLDGSFRLTPGEGRGTTSGERQIKIKIVGENTGDRYSIVEDALPPKSPGPPLHVHRKTNEAFYVVKGFLKFLIGTEKVDAPAGAFVFIPGGTAHALMNPTDEPAIYLLIMSPPGFEKYFEELADIVNNNPTPETLMSIARRHDMEVVGSRMAP
jgi:quercetin dioxygenase-like cupin family protein